MTKLFFRSKGFISAICGVALLAALLLSFAIVSVAASSGATYYFDSEAKANGNGTKASPYNSLDAISELDLEPGDTIYLKKGSVFAGPLRLVGINGSEGAPITVTSYGEGRLPRIDGRDTIGDGVLYIENCNWLTVSDIQICDTATYTADRRGVYVYGASDGVYSGITLSGLYVHDIRGVAGIAASSAEGARFDSLVISDCYLTDIYGVGISVGQDSPGTPSASSSHTNVKISGNRISYSGGAILACGMYGGTVDNNVAFGITESASFVTEYVDGTVIERNESYLNSSESTAFYAGEMSLDTVWQYNYSHDNSGGFFAAHSDSDATLCYNLSLYDLGTIISDSGADLEVYNNTIISPRGYSVTLLDVDGGSYINNLIYNNSATAKVTLSGAAEIKSNLVYNASGANIDGLDSFKSANASGLYTDPMFSGEFGKSVSARAGIENAVFAQLSSSSPALNAGLSVGAAGDFFGNAYSASIGFYCGSGNSAPSVDYELSADDLKEYAYSDIEILQDIVYGTATTYKGGTKTLTLDIYSALDCENRNRPLLLMIHGGGLRTDSTKEQSYAVKISKLMASKGYVVASINYRTRDGGDMPDKASSAPALMDAAEDANTALLWLREQASVYGFNPDYIFVAGGSAGGATTMCYAFAEDSRGFDKSGIVAVADLWGGPRDVFAGCYDSDFSQDDRFPTIFIHGTGDTTMDYNHSLNAYNAMVAAGITASWNPVEGAEHSLSGYDDTYEFTTGLISEFFAARLAEKIEADNGYTQPPERTDREDSDNNLPISTPEKIYPNADLYINSNPYGKNASLHKSNSLYVFDSNSSSYIRKTFMRFDTVLGSEGAYPYSTVLNFTVTDVTRATAAEPLAVAVYGLSDNYWFADEIIWKNTPDTSNKTYIGTVYITGKGNYSIDVSNYVYQVQQSGIPTVTFFLEGMDSPAESRRATIASYESGSNAPYLACSYIDTPVTVNTVSVNTYGEGEASESSISVLTGSSAIIQLSPEPGYMPLRVEVDTALLGVSAKLSGNEVIVENIVADTVLSVYFSIDTSVIIASDSATVRYGNLSGVETNATVSTDSTNVNPLYLCTKAPSGENNNSADRIIWLQFDIDGYDFTGKSVAFEIYCYQLVEFGSATMPVDVYATTNTDWSSGSISWSSQPAFSGLGYADSSFGISGGAQKIGSFAVNAAATWYTVDITSYVRMLKMSGFTSFSLALVDSSYTSAAPIARFVSTHGTAALNGVSLKPKLTTESLETSQGTRRIDLDVSVTGTQNGSVTGYENVIEAGASVLDIEANEGYVAQVTVDGKERKVYDGKLCLFGADENTKIVVSFVKMYSLTVTTDDNCRASLESALLGKGDDASVSFYVAPGYKLVVKVNGQIVEISDNTLTLKPLQDLSVTAESVKIK